MPPKQKAFMMAKNKNSGSTRVDALSDFRAAQKMLTEGEAELARAQGKIKIARELLVKNSDLIRSTWNVGREARQRRKK